MIKEIKRLKNKYMKIREHSEYVSLDQIINDLHRLEQDVRINILPKDER